MRITNLMVNSKRFVVFGYGWCGRGVAQYLRALGGTVAQPLGPQAALDVVGMPPQREQREVTLWNDVGAVARPPELGERRIIPRRRLDPVDARVQREQCRPRHAVLQARPRSAPQRLRALRHSLLEPTDPSSERQNLLPCEPKSRRH